MSWIAIVIIVALVAGIIFITHGSQGQKPRGIFLQELAKFLEGKLEPLSQHPNSFQIYFSSAGKEFIYEDIEDKGFGKALNKAYLKARTLSAFVLYFTEKTKVTRIKSDFFMASEIPEAVIVEAGGVNVLKEFKDLNVHTNDVLLTNKLFENLRTKKIFLDFKNVDARGCPFMALKVLGGEIILEFYPTSIFHPSFMELQRNIHVIEEYLLKLIEIIDFINQT